MSEKPCAHYWVKFVREGVDLERYDAKRVCKFCGADLGFEPHRRENTLLGFCQRLMREGKLSEWETTLVNEFAKGDLDASKRRILERIARQDRKVKA